MKVEATKRGYFDLKVREPGEQFNIPDEPKGKDGKPAAFSARWMKSLEALASPAKEEKDAGGDKKGKK